MLKWSTELQRWPTSVYSASGWRPL